MKLLRLTMLFATLTVMMLGVQLVQACEGWFVRYTSAGRLSCWNVGSDEAGNCYYSCTYSPVNIV